MSDGNTPDPTKAAILHARSAQALLLLLGHPESVRRALRDLSALMKRGRADYKAVCALNTKLMPLRAAAGRPAVAIGPRDCTTAHCAGVIATWCLERMVRQALMVSPEVYTKDRQRYDANLDEKKPFDYELAKDYSDVIVRAAHEWQMPMRGLIVEIEYERALLTNPKRASGSRKDDPGGEPRRRRGAPQKYDKDEDKRIHDNQEASGLTAKEYAIESGQYYPDVDAAIKRHNERERKERLKRLERRGLKKHQPGKKT